ncbi:unnamed protein product [Prorocentrum cordatum]|uniref:Uncharacterized protein n=1 Tax=Prorocentrum cordatum TaxID=2364126 RepID=A0ABN9TAD8_9DINO|nr:unnamed protein product [Polarella glacialis]
MPAAASASGETECSSAGCQERLADIRHILDEEIEKLALLGEERRPRSPILFPAAEAWAGWPGLALPAAVRSPLPQPLPRALLRPMEPEKREALLRMLIAETQARIRKTRSTPPPIGASKKMRVNSCVAPAPSTPTTPRSRPKSTLGQTAALSPSPMKTTSAAVLMTREAKIVRPKQEIECTRTALAEAMSMPRQPRKDGRDTLHQAELRPLTDEKARQNQGAPHIQHSSDEMTIKAIFTYADDAVVLLEQAPVPSEVQVPSEGAGPPQSSAPPNPLEAALESEVDWDPMEAESESVPESEVNWDP